MYDGERRKSMAVEKSAAQLKSENQSLRQEVSKLEDEVNQLNQNLVPYLNSAKIEASLW